MSFNFLGSELSNLLKDFVPNAPAPPEKGPATPAQRQAATEAVQKWAAHTGPSPWKNIPRAEFANALCRTLKNPVSLDQRDTNLCGVAVACKIAADYIPARFAEMAMALYDRGTYLSYAANPASLAATQFNGLSPSDYVVMSSLRHSLNSGLNPYDPSQDQWGISGFSWPDDPGKILRSLGMRETSADYAKHPAKLLALFKAKQNQDAVLAAVNTDYFMKGKPGTTLADFLPSLPINTSDHFIELTRIEPIGNQSLRVGWWSWGKQMADVEMSPQRFEASVWVLRCFNR